MTTNDKSLLIPLELTLADLVWLCAFLEQERSAADVDRQKAADLHTILASRSAVNVIDQERETMTRIVDEICRVVAAADAHDSLMSRIAAQLDQPAA